MSTPRSILRVVGSLWFAAVLLVLWLVAMACATVVESARGTERALVEFYHSWWFEWLLGLLALNVTAAVLLRLPLRRRHAGFVMTHCGILITFAGALVTRHWGVDGRIGLAEKETADTFRVVGESVLSITDRQAEESGAALLAGSVFRGLTAADRPGAPPFTVGGVRAEVRRYVPDSAWVRELTNDNPAPNPAVQVMLSATEPTEPAWLFANEAASVNGVEAVYRLAVDDQELARLLAMPAAAAADRSPGIVRVSRQGATYELGLRDCLAGAVPIGDTGYTARVLRYLPHANVSEDRRLVNVSERPLNPAIELELAGPDGTETRLAFARFPEFRMMHGEKQTEDIRITFVAPEEPEPPAPIEVVGAPDGRLYARFHRKDNDDITVQEVAIGAPVETAWRGWSLTVFERFDRARVRWTAEPILPPRETRIPAVLLALAGENGNRELWVQKHRPRTVALDGRPLEISYADRELPLGFALTLNRFHLGVYPGTRRPRTFESHVTIVDPTTGRTRNQVISMNRPVQHGGFSLFQSSYSMAGGQRMSYLSVSRDPGQAVVFAGYVITTAGMLVVFFIRVSDRRRERQAGHGITPGDAHQPSAKVAARKKPVGTREPALGRG